MNQPAKRQSSVQVAALGGAIITTAMLSLFGPAWCRSVRAALQDSPKSRSRPSVAIGKSRICGWHLQ